MCLVTNTPKTIHLITEQKIVFCRPFRRLKKTLINAMQDHMALTAVHFSMNWLRISM